MARYFKEAELLEFINKNVATTEDGFTTMTCVNVAVLNTPTADVEEVKHGEWSVAIGYDIKKKVKCSVCELMTFEPTAYCPHCGAKMDGGKTE